MVPRVAVVSRPVLLSVRINGIPGIVTGAAIFAAWVIVGVLAHVINRVGGVIIAVNFGIVVRSVVIGVVIVSIVSIR